MGVITAIRYRTGNVILQFPGMTDVWNHLPSRSMKLWISVKMLLTDTMGGVSLVLPNPEAADLPEVYGVSAREIGLIEIDGYGFRADREVVTTLYRILSETGTDIIGLSASDTALTLAVDAKNGGSCMAVLQEHFGAMVE